MAISTIILGYSIVAGMMASLLLAFTLFFEKNKKKSKILLVWAVLFLVSSFATSEYALWQEGVDLFKMVFSFNFPLFVYFGVWFAFLIWIFETRKERKVWIILMILLIATVIIAVNCMDCIRF